MGCVNTFCPYYDDSEPDDCSKYRDVRHCENYLEED